MQTTLNKAPAHTLTPLTALAIAITSLSLPGCTNTQLQPNDRPAISHTSNHSRPNYASFIASAQPQPTSTTNPQPDTLATTEPAPLPAKYDTTYTAASLPDWARRYAGFDIEHHAFLPALPDHLYEISPPTRSYYNLDDDCDTDPEYDKALHEYHRLIKLRTDIEKLANKHRTQLGLTPYHHQTTPHKHVNDITQHRTINRSTLPDSTNSID